MIPAHEWLWFGRAMHFICGSDCQFHMATKVGDYIVSTVGQLWPDSTVRRIQAQVKNKLDGAPLPKGIGNEYDANYFKQFGWEDIGFGRKYETMVFLAKPCKRKGCACGGWEADAGAEVHDLMKGYNQADLARDGHMDACHRVARGDFQPTKPEEEDEY